MKLTLANSAPEYPRELAYDENGVKIYAFPVIHALAGSMGYRLEWNGLTFVYTADSQPEHLSKPNKARARMCLSMRYFRPLRNLLTITTCRLNRPTASWKSTPRPRNWVASTVLPSRRLGVGMHFTLDEDLIDPLFQRWSKTYNDPVLLMQDLTTINVTSDYILVRQSKVDLLAWPAPPPELPEGIDLSPGEPSKAQRPSWLTETRIPQEN